MAMEETILKQIPCSKFLKLLGRDSLFEGFVQYLVSRIAEHQQFIVNLVTVDSEQRLGKTLLQLAQLHKAVEHPPYLRYLFSSSYH